MINKTLFYSDYVALRNNVKVVLNIIYQKFDLCAWACGRFAHYASYTNTASHEKI